MDNPKKKRKERDLTKKNEEISGRKVHTNKWKLNWNVSMITDVFLDHKRVNVCEHTVKMAPHEIVPCGAVFTVYSHTLTLFWSRKTSVKIETTQLSFHVFMCAIRPEISSFLLRVFPFFSYFLCYSYFSTFHSTWSQVKT